MADKKNMLAYMLMGLGGGLSGQNYLGSYESARRQEEAYKRRLAEWNMKQTMGYQQKAAGQGWDIRTANPQDYETARKLFAAKMGMKKPTKGYYEQYDEDIRQAEAGQLKWGQLEQKYPRKREDIEEFRKESLPKLERSPKFRMGKGLPAYFSKDIANINPTTLKIIDQIENIEDLRELLERADEARIKGIDIAGILEYFGKSREEIEALSEESL